MTNTKLENSNAYTSKESDSNKTTEQKPPIWF